MRADPVPASARPAPGSATAAGWWPLAVVATAHLMAILDTTVMFVALPSAQQALGLSVAGRQWVITAFTLAFAAVLLPGGRLADRFGARRTLLAGVIGFACASAVGGAATGGAMLIAARAVQGAFGAVLVSSTKSVLVTVYSDEARRARAVGIFTATLTGGAAAGLVLGGVLTSELGWRWCLYVNVVLAAAAVTGALLAVPEVPGRPAVRIDVASAALACAGMAALVYGFGEVPDFGWASAGVAGSLTAAAVLLGLFGVRQAAAASPLLPLRVLRDRDRGGALAAMVVNSLSTFGMLLILTYQLQAVMGYSALRTGLALIPFAATAALGAALIAPFLAARVSPRWLIAAGLVLSAAGLAPLTALTASSRYLPLVAVAEIIEGLGTGIGGPPMLQTALGRVLAADTGAAAAASSAAAQLGSSVGAALLNTIAATAAAAYLAGHAAVGQAGANVHGYAVAMAWGAGILLAAVIPVVALVRAGKPATGRNARFARSGGG